MYEVSLVNFSLRGKDSYKEISYKKFYKSNYLSCPSTNIFSPVIFSHIVFITLAKVVLMCPLTVCFPSLGVK